MNYTLITGASSGIGKALAEVLAEEGSNLILVARSVDKLEALAASLKQQYKIGVQVFAIDLLEKDAADRIYEWCVKHNYFVRILINNAGFGLYGWFEELSLEEQVDMVHLNQAVLVSLCHNFLPMIKEVPNAHILNVASTAAFQPVPFMSIYAGTKAFVLLFSRGLRKELKGYGVNVSCLCPGPTKSEFMARAGFLEKQKEFTSIQMDAKQVARIAVEEMFNRKAVIIPGFTNKLGTFLTKIVPANIMDSFTNKILRPKRKITQTNKPG